MIFFRSVSLAQVEYQGQTRYTRNLDNKFLINTYCRVFLFAHFSLNARQASH